MKPSLVREFKFPSGEQVDAFRNVMVTESNRARLGPIFLKAYLVVWDAPGDSVMLFPRSWIRELMKANGLPLVPTPLGVPEPEVAPLPPRAEAGQ